MKYVLFGLITIAILSLPSCGAKRANTIEEAVAAFCKALVTPDQTTLETLTSPSLLYGHSSGLIENRETFIQSLVTGKYDILNLEVSGQTVLERNNFAVVRHLLTGDTHDAGKPPGQLKLHVLTIWEQTDKGWNLLSRQAVKLAE